MNREAVLSAMVHRGTVSHAYLFSGGSGAFLSHYSQYLALALNCTHADNKPCKTCPSCTNILHHHSLAYREWKAPNGKFTIDLVRQIQEEVKYSPAQGYRIIALSFAESFTLEAANAFLKTLEEPPARICFILLSKQPWSVLSTLQSRCQHLTFPRLPETEIFERLRQTYPEQSQEIMEKCGQNAELIASYLEQEMALTTAYTSIEKIKKTSLTDRLLIAQDMAQDKPQTKVILGIWLKELWQLFLQGQVQEKKNIDLVIENINQMKYNLNLRLHLETLLIHIN